MYRRFAALLLFAALPAALPAQAQMPRTITVGSIQLTRCGEPDIYCGRLERPLDPTGEIKDRIGIFFEYVPRRDRKSPATGTLSAAEGGPGYPTTGSAETYLELFRPLMEHRDVVMMDYRGTGRSGAIDCKELQTAPKLSIENFAKCGEQLGPRAPLYSAALAADDMEAILTVLGRGPIDLYGDSYGTWFSQIFAVRHPEMMRSIVLDGAYPVRPVMGESPWQPFYAEQMRRKFDLLCARSPSCARIPGSSIDHIKPALEALRAHPFDAAALDADGTRQQFRADPVSLAMVMFGQSPSRTTARETDAASRAFANGDKLPLLRLMAETYATEDSRDPAKNPVKFSEGQAAAVSCGDSEQIYDMTLPPSERVAQRDRLMAEKEASQPDLFAPFRFSEYRGLPLDWEFIDGCVRWPVPRPPYKPHDTLPASLAYPAIPALVISGELDDITTAAQGNIAAAQFPKGRHVVVANSFHVNALSPDSGSCVPDIVRHFVETLDPGPTDCADKVPATILAPDFVRHAAEAAPATPLSGNAVEQKFLALAASAVFTAADALDRLESRGGDRPVPGLRGGSFTVAKTGSATQLTLDKLRWAEDLTVSGTVEEPDGAGTVTAELSVQGPDGVTGRITAFWPLMTPSASARLGGTIDGKTLAAEMPSP